MDIFAHGLWGILTGKFYNLKAKGKIKPLWAAFWTIFPDLFAFGITFLWLGASFAMGGNIFHLEPAQRDTLPIFRLTSFLYHLSHSIIIFAAAYSTLILFNYWKHRRLKWNIPMLGWLLHILLDIPSHSYAFYPTPFLWPLSGLKVNGVAWSEPWFMAANYTLIIAGFAGMWAVKRYKPALKL